MSVENIILDAGFDRFRTRDWRKVCKELESMSGLENTDLLKRMYAHIKHMIESAEEQEKYQSPTQWTESLGLPFSENKRSATTRATFFSNT